MRVVFGDAALSYLAERILVAKASQNSLQRLVVAYHTFHAVRGDHINLVRATGSTDRVLDGAELARVCLSEAHAAFVRYSFTR